MSKLYHLYPTTEQIQQYAKTEQWWEEEWFTSNINELKSDIILHQYGETQDITMVAFNTSKCTKNLHYHLIVEVNISAYEFKRNKAIHKNLYPFWYNLLVNEGCFNAGKPSYVAIKTEQHLINVKKYIINHITEQRGTIVHAINNNNNSTIEPPKEDDITIDQFRNKYPTDEDWKDEAINIYDANKKNKFITYCTQREQEWLIYQKSMPYNESSTLTEDEKTYVIKLLEAANIIENKYNSAGKVGVSVLIEGPAKTGKSEFVRNLAHLVCRNHHIWTGKQFAERDNLKYDDLIRTLCNGIVVEEMHFSIPSARITHLDTLHQIKSLFTGDGINARTAKNIKTCNSKLNIKYLFVTFNDNHVISSYKHIEELINGDEAFKRRIMLYSHKDIIPSIPNFEKCNTTLIKQCALHLYKNKINAYTYFNRAKELKTVTLPITNYFKRKEPIKEPQQLISCFKCKQLGHYANTCTVKKLKSYTEFLAEPFDEGEHEDLWKRYDFSKPDLTGKKYDNIIIPEDI